MVACACNCSEYIQSLPALHRLQASQGYVVTLSQKPRQPGLGDGYIHSRWSVTACNPRARGLTPLLASEGITLCCLHPHADILIHKNKNKSLHFSAK